MTLQKLMLCLVIFNMELSLITNLMAILLCLILCSIEKLMDRLFLDEKNL